MPITDKNIDNVHVVLCLLMMRMNRSPPLDHSLPLTNSNKFDEEFRPPTTDKL